MTVPPVCLATMSDELMMVPNGMPLPRVDEGNRVQSVLAMLRQMTDEELGEVFLGMWNEHRPRILEAFQNRAAPESITSFISDDSQVPYLELLEEGRHMPAAVQPTVWSWLVEGMKWFIRGLWEIVTRPVHEMERLFEALLSKFRADIRRHFPRPSSAQRP